MQYVDACRIFSKILNDIEIERNRTLHWHGTALKYIALIAWDGQKDIYFKYFIKK